MKSFLLFLFVFCLICACLSISISYKTLFDNALTDIIYAFSGVPAGVVYNKFFVVEHYIEISQGETLVLIDSTDSKWPEIVDLNSRLERVHKSYLEVHRFFSAKFQYWLEDVVNDAYNFNYSEGELFTDTIHIINFITAYNNALYNNAPLPPLGEIFFDDDGMSITMDLVNFDNLLFYLREYELIADEILSLMAE